MHSTGFLMLMIVIISYYYTYLNQQVYQYQTCRMFMIKQPVVHWKILQEL